jgi:hypothetical protein
MIFSYKRNPMRVHPDRNDRTGKLRTSKIHRGGQRRVLAITPFVA